MLMTDHTSPPQLDQTSSSALLQWKQPHDNGANITNYVLEVTGTTTFTVNVPASIKNSMDFLDSHDFDDEYSMDDDVSSHFSSHDDERSKASLESRSHDYMEHEVTGLQADTAYRYFSVFLNHSNVVLYSDIMHCVE